MMQEVIDRFNGNHEFLSNFYQSPVVFGGQQYPTVEHAYQAAKTLDMAERHIIRLASTPGAAKRYGKPIGHPRGSGKIKKIRGDWDVIKVSVMRDLVYQKFGAHENQEPTDLGEKLLLTGDAELVEGNNWFDHFWGVSQGVGANWLGRILMDARDILKIRMIDSPKG